MRPRCCAAAAVAVAVAGAGACPVLDVKRRRASRAVSSPDAGRDLDRRSAIVPLPGGVRTRPAAGGPPGSCLATRSPTFPTPRGAQSAGTAL
eukprot:scaffold1675_cov361-Prasinococcus_capsulatus_cf.AAC.8